MLIYSHCHCHSLCHSLSHSFTLFLTLSNSLFIIDTCGIQNWVKASRSWYRKLAQVGFEPITTTMEVIYQVMSLISFCINLVVLRYILICSHCHSLPLFHSLSLSQSLTVTLSFSHSHSLTLSLTFSFTLTLSVSDTCGIQNWVKAFRSWYRKLVQVGFKPPITTICKDNQVYWSIRAWVWLALAKIYISIYSHSHSLTLCHFLTFTVALTLSHGLTLSVSHSLTLSLYK